MGIKDLVKVLGDHAAKSMVEKEIKTYFGRKVAIDASMSIYQFLIAVRQQDGVQMTNEAGEVTSHLLGLFYRTIRMIDCGIKPVYVFDGKPPELKSGELEKRTERRAAAEKAREEAQEAGDQEQINKFDRRLVKVTKQHNEDCKRLLTCMGVPWISAPSEAEAQCAALVKYGLAYATGTEDMDALTFGSKVLLRHLTVAESRKLPIKEFHLDKILAEMEMTQNEFIDLCILLGCDYCDSIRGIGPKKAIQLIKEHKSIEEILKHIDKSKYPVPENWLYKEARKLFLEPEVLPQEEIDLKWLDPDEDALVEYLVKEKGFAEERVRNGCKKLQKARSTTVQGRLDSFITVRPSTSTSKPSTKRKAEAQKPKQSKKGNFKKR